MTTHSGALEPARVGIALNALDWAAGQSLRLADICAIERGQQYRGPAKRCFIELVVFPDRRTMCIVTWPCLEWTPGIRLP